MLASSHECGAPMFRYKGKVMCPVCESGNGEEKKTAVEQAVSGKPPRVQKESVPETPSRFRGDNSQIAEMTRKKIQEIAGSLENETDLRRIKEKMECVELGIRILKLLES